MSNDSSMVLALLSGLACLVLSALVFLGHSASGHWVDLFPCIATGLMVPVVVHTAGRLTRTRANVITLLFTIGGLGAGKLLSGSLSLLMDRHAPQAELTFESWLDVLYADWISRPVDIRRINALLYLLTPILAVCVIPICRRLDSIGWRHARLSTLISSTTPFTSRRWLMVIACGWSLLVMAGHITAGRSNNSGVLNFTLPVVTANQSNTLLGFAYLVDGEPVMAETVPAVEQAAWFRGHPRSDSNFRFLRAGYALLAVLITPWLEPKGSLIVFNVAAWGVSIACVWRLTTRLFRDDVAACLASMLAALGSGYALHWNATTPHLASFALYACGVLVIIETKLTSCERLWPIHFLVGIGLGLISLVYNVWLMLAVVYMACSLQKQRYVHIIGAGILALSFQPLWRAILPGLGINVVDVEGDYLGRAIEAWGEIARAGVLRVLFHGGGLLLECVTAMESPIIMMIGGIGLCLTIPKEHRLFVFTAIAAPVLACLVFSPVATARGYLVYGSSCLWFAAAGRLLSIGLRSPGLRRWAVTAITVGAVLAQLAWSTAHLYGFTGPAVTYFLGWDQGWGLFQERAPEIVSLNGKDAVPAVYDGVGSAETTNAFKGAIAAQVQPPSRWLAYLSRMLFLTGGCLLLCAFVETSRHRFICVGVFLSISIVATEISFLVPCHSPAFWDLSRALSLEPNDSVTLHVDVPGVIHERIVDRLEERNVAGSLYIPTAADCDITLTIDGHPIPLSPVIRQEAACLAMRHFEDLDAVRTWEVTLTNTSAEPIRISGWQRLDTPGKSQSNLSAICLPAIEFRIRRRSSGALTLLAF